MPKIVNKEKNVILELNLLNNTYLDIDFLREDFENWIPFDFALYVENEIYRYPPENGATFTLYELRNLITQLNKIIILKKEKLEIEKYLFSSLEGYFDLILYDPLEEDALSLEVWINMGTLTEGKSYGYNKGFQFDAELKQVKEFTKQLTEQFNKILSETERNK
ncbi:hypothetical protein acsn021_02440 [Anaerocolumna cellulosilytica]|uniref:Uncharacterized protein n=1 Tax=Anaerocolumna cellulosilytica TaxID=433286 RepID=A0A6S6QZ53_9FIRM|nr:hypothetical protein [Anaerocolumna cellulosilytica]MBB5196925.1 hypothetical protein [Anaerocolumna cellulosilytica]BCJ92675.1 hypothetical protein acsn021_02440 [Anaerocolumna cellulosilytica]